MSADLAMRFLVVFIVGAVIGQLVRFLWETRPSRTAREIADYIRAGKAHEKSRRKR